MENKEALQTVKEIKSMMEQSSRFLSFSGISAIIIGFYALIAAAMALRILENYSPYYDISVESNLILKLSVLAVGVFLLALATVLFLSWIKARKIHARFFSKVTYRTFLHFFLPLVTGGLFCAAMVHNGYVGVIAPAMLLFYGLSLINVSKYVHNSIFWLGCTELLLGIICAFLPYNGLLFWSLGFGVLHVIYGIYFYVGVENNRTVLE